jgi:hypothetical protein
MKGKYMTKSLGLNHGKKSQIVHGDLRVFCSGENILLNTRLQPGGGREPGEKPFETVFLSAGSLATALKRGVYAKFSTEQDCCKVTGLEDDLNREPSERWLFLHLQQSAAVRRQIGGEIFLSLQILS